MVDMAHYAGLIAAGLYPSPVGVAHYVTSTTHKTLRGPRGGFILADADHAKSVNSAVFPGWQGGPLMHVIAAKAVAFKEAQSHEFRVYQERVLENARVLAVVLQERGLRIVSGGTESHMFLVDLRAKKITGKDAEAALGRVHITVNKNAIPNDPEKPFVTSGIRVGSPAITTRGFSEIECEELAHLIADVLDAPGDAATSKRVQAAAAALAKRYPVYKSPGHRQWMSGCRTYGSVENARASRRHGDRLGRRPSCASNAMKCPFCGSPDTQVVDSRVSEAGDSIRRRRRCLACQKRFTTYENAELRLPQIVKQNGTRSDFDVARIRNGFQRALHKRPVPTEYVDQAVERIVQAVLGLGEREIPSRQVGEMVMQELYKLDKVAYIRFASVYRSFQDVADFRDALKEVEPAPPRRKPR